MPSDDSTSVAERRKYPRLPVRHAASLESDFAGTLNVVIENYCPGGLYASLMDQSAIAEHPAARHLDTGEEVAVRIDFDNPQASQTLPARVARIGELGFGLAFLSAQPDLSEALREVSQAQGFLSRTEAAPEKRSTLLHQVSELCDGFLSRHTRTCFENAKDSLLTAAADAPGDVGQTPFFEAMSLLRKHGEEIRSDFRAAVDAHFESFDTVQPIASIGSEEKTADEMSLVDEEEFETWLALSEIIAGVENRNHDQLHGLEARLSQMTGKGVNSRNNPLGPAVICHHFHQAINRQEFSHQPAQVLWRTFGKTVAAELRSLYREVNDLLMDAGILPNLVVAPLRPRRPAPRPVPGPEAPAEALAQPMENRAGAPAPAHGHPRHYPAEYADAYMAPPPATATTGSKIIDIQELLASRLKPRSAPVESGPPQPPFGLAELEQALADLQRAHDQDRRYPLGSRIDEALRRRHGLHSQRPLANKHAKAILLAQELLSTISDDSVVDPRAKEWIQRLEIQLLKMFLSEQDVLADPEHPARDLLNQLGRASIGKVQELNAREQQLVDKIDGIVDRLSEMQHPDRDSFADAAQQLETLLKRQHRLRSTQLKRVLEAAEGQQRLDQARAGVQALLNERFAGRQVPKPVLDLLRLGWRNLLDLAAVRAGPDGEECRDAMTVVEDLDRLLDAEAKPTDKDLTRSRELLKQIDERLTESRVDAADRSTLLKQLKELLPGPDKPPERQPERIDFRPERPPTPPEPDDADPENAHWLGMAKMLDKGSWLLFPAPDGTTQPIKLAWISDNRDRYVFVNRNGQKALEISPGELAEKLHAKQAQMVDQPDQPLVDRTWHGMVQTMHDQLAHQATHDQLTECLNRKEFERQIRLKLGESKLMHTQHIALQIEIDQFRVINNTSGHDAGDQLLQDLARTMRRQLGADGGLARLGGDTFAVLLPRTEPAPGHEVAEKLRRAITDHRTRWKRSKLKATASIGLVSIDRASESVSQVLNQMDSACSAAKDAGRDRVKSYQIDDQELSQRDRAMALVTELESALDSDRIELYGQRILPLSPGADGKHHFEVLCRMRAKDGSLVLPDEFVPAAEAYGRIHFLDEWVFRRAFAMLTESPLKSKVARLSLNLSAKTFGRPRFLAFVQRLFEETGLEPSKICFEITETAAISNLSRCTDFLRELRYLGCRFSLDDFGTGLSSFSYLKHLPVDYLKIDGSFVKDIASSTADYGLVRTINEIGHFLGKETVAEYVESEEVLEHLREIGLDFAQGFAIEEPRPLVEILEVK